MRAIILAGGAGARLHPYSVVFPKPLMPIGEMPIIEIVIRQLAEHGITHITMAVGHLAELMIAFLGEGQRLGVQIDYVREDRPLGTAAPLKGIPDLPDTFLVMNGDLLTTLDYSKLIAEHKRAENDLTIACHTRHVEVDFGVIETDEAGRVTNYKEKPVLNYKVSMGAYVFDRSVLQFIPGNEYFDFNDLVMRALNTKRVGTYSFDGLWLDIGRPDDYAEAQTLYQEKRDLFLAKTSS